MMMLMMSTSTKRTI